MNSRSAGSRVINSKRRSGGSSGNRSRIRWRDAKKISPNVTTVSSTDTGTDIELTDKADPPIPNYAQNEYNYGAGNSPRPRTGTTNSMDGKTGRGSWRNKLAPQTSEYQDPLTDEQEEPMKLRPERKLRNTAVITSDPTFFPYHTKRPLGEGGSVESSHTDDMVIVRNVDYSVQYDEAPILESAQRSPSSDDRQTSL